MNITEDKEFRAALLRKIETREFHERRGIHQSDLTYCLNKQALRRIHPVVNTDADLLLYSIGWSTQRWLTGADEDEPEIEVDGIIVTLDALAPSGRRVFKKFGDTNIEVEVDEMIPWELKASFQSSARPVEENVPWLKQIAAQCYVKGVTSARLSRMEIMGNWKSVFGKKILDLEGNVIGNEKDLESSRKPTLTAWRFDFTTEELQRNWAWLIDRKEKFETLLQTGTLLPKIVAIPSGQDYEAERCSYRGNLCKECP